MVLLVWSSERCAEGGAAIGEALHEPVRVAANLQHAIEQLQTAAFSLVIFDDRTIDRAPSETELAFQHLGEAIPVVVNFAISGMDRIVAFVRTARERRRIEVYKLEESVRSGLRAQFKDDVTALLLLCGVARQDPALAAAGSERISKIEEIASSMREKLLETNPRMSKAAHG